MDDLYIVCELDFFYNKKKCKMYANDIKIKYQKSNTYYTYITIMLCIATKSNNCYIFVNLIPFF